MKTTMKKLALLTITAFLIFAGNANATEGERNALIHESIEEKLCIEDWMINESVWNIGQDIQLEITEEKESGLKIENWMVNTKLWETTIIADEKDKELFVELWMTNENLWNQK